MKLGFGDRKTEAPTTPQELINFLSQIMSSAINNDVDLENARIALNASTRIVEVWQADTRMKALAIASGRLIDKSKGWSLIDDSPKLIADTQPEMEAT
jgi:hypothetical protein